MTSKELLQATLKHKDPGKIVVDFGGTAVTGIHVLAIENLRKYYHLPYMPVRLIEPYQMLGEIDNELSSIMGIDVIGKTPRINMFGFENKGWHEFKTFWGQVLLVPEDFITSIDDNGNLLIYPEGDATAAPSGKMPKASYFFDTIIRQEPIYETTLNPEDNCEEFNLLSQEDIAYWKSVAGEIKNSDKGVIATFGGLALGDIALVPAPFMKRPKGIRDISEWYVSTLMRPDFVHAVFEKQTQFALQNLETIYFILGNTVDAVFICGTDFGTQDKQFCSPDTFDELYAPYYKLINGWIHKNTAWKTFKHSCGAIEPLISNLINAGFDIINPVQINASGMDPELLKKKFGEQLVFWGGGVDTQKVLPFLKPSEVEKQVLELCEIFGKNGGFVFNSVHNIQANVPVENIVAMINAINKFNGN
jgi:hypothetical protein